MPAMSINSESVTVLNSDNPWPGLLAYVEKDKDYFNGRENESEELYNLVLRQQLTILFGNSGLGKTSLLQAGLFPKLREENILPVYIRLGFTKDQPDLVEQVKSSIINHSKMAGVECPDLVNVDTLWECFHRQNSDFWSARNKLLQPILVFDQFEEIFTLGVSDTETVKASKEFLVQLADLIEGRPPESLRLKLEQEPTRSKGYVFNSHNYKILFSLREDYLPELEGLRSLIPSVSHNRFRLLGMDGEAAFRVVASAQNLIDKSVAEKIVRFVSAKHGEDVSLKEVSVEPALLSIVCSELNNKRKADNKNKISESLLEGSQEEILYDFYDRSVSDLHVAIQSLIEEKLLTVSGFRDSLALENALSIPNVEERDINRLVDRRLIRKEERGGVVRIELTHDLLTGVIETRRNERRQFEEKEKLQKELDEQRYLNKLKSDARSARIMKWFLGVVIVLSGGLFFSAMVAQQQKEEAVALRMESEKAKQSAEAAESLAKQRLQQLRVRAELRRAIVSRDQKQLDNLLETIKIDDTIKFRVIAKQYPYKSVDGLPTFKFSLFPTKGSLAGRFKEIAFITYVMDHPSFLNPLILTGPDTNFTGVYDGVGCLIRVIALIEYTDLERPLAIKQIPMCNIQETIPYKK